jgi:uncharacterized protein
MITRRLLLAAPLVFTSAPAQAGTWPQRLVEAAEAQVGRTLFYDPAYVRISYPGGDVPQDRGVCTDVIIRAYRDGLDFDLQKAVHEDMAAHFSAYPQHWGLARTDSNIDHRRVPNLQTYFNRKGAALAVTSEAADYVAGDLVTMMLPGNLPHIGIVSATMNDDATRPLLVHNIGGGTQRQDVLFTYPATGHYRFNPG